MLFTDDCLCWISKERRKLLIPLPRWLRRAGVREDEEKVCKRAGVHGRGLFRAGRGTCSVIASVQHFPAPAGSHQLCVCPLIVRTQAVGLQSKAFGAEEVVSALYTFLGFLLPQTTSSLIPWSEEPLMLT